VLCALVFGGDEEAGAAAAQAAAIRRQLYGVETGEAPGIITHGRGNRDVFPEAGHDTREASLRQKGVYSSDIEAAAALSRGLGGAEAVHASSSLQGLKA